MITIDDIALNNLCRKPQTVVLRTNSKAVHSSGFKKLAVQWLNEHLSFVSSVVLSASFVL